MYVAKVEIEFETALDPLESLRLLLKKLEWPDSDGSKGLGHAEHWHIIELPRELNK